MTAELQWLWIYILSSPSHFSSIQGRDFVKRITPEFVAD